MLRFLYTQHVYAVHPKHQRATLQIPCSLIRKTSASDSAGNKDQQEWCMKDRQSGYMCLFEYLKHGYYYYQSSSIGDSLSSFYVCEGSKNLSD